MIHSTTWMKLGKERQKEKYCMLLLTRSIYSSQIHKDRKENGGCQGLRIEEDRELLLYGYRVSWGSWKSSGNKQCWWLYNNVNELNATEPYTKIVNFMLYVFHCILLQPKRMNTTGKLDKRGAHQTEAKYLSTPLFSWSYTQAFDVAHTHTNHKLKISQYCTQQSYRPNTHTNNETFALLAFVWPLRTHLPFSFFCGNPFLLCFLWSFSLDERPILVCVQCQTLTLSILMLYTQQK